MLLLFAIGLYDPDHVPHFKRTQQYTVQECKWLCGFASSFHRIITTPHILAELSNLAIDHRQASPPPYLPKMLELIRQTKELFIEKESVLDEDFLPKLGLTDSIILRLSMDKKYLVITEDFPLYGYLLVHKCEAINFNHVRSQGWL